MEWLAAPVKRLREWLSRVFSPRVEDSFRLRGLGLAALWLAALGLLWVGGNSWLTLGGGGIGTLGHWVSWRRRNLQSRAWSLLIAALAIGLSFAMRSQMLEVFNGNWIPLGHFLVLVMALATFDLRTRGGLYAGLVLSGLVLFFASQQAFAPIFGVFLAGFAVLLLAFLSLAFLEDGVRDAQVHWVHRRLSGAAYWGGTACAVFLLSALAFWLMPRGQDSLIGAPQVAVLPVTGGSFPALIVEPAGISPVVVGDAADNEVEGLISDDGKTSSTTDGGDGSDRIPDDAFQVELNPDGDDVEFYVRSKVASYWRGLTLDVFDGRYWRAGITRSRQFQSPDGSRIWYNRDSVGLDNRIQYNHTFFIQQDQPPDALFMGYRGLRIVGENGGLAGDGLQGGDTYRVRSAYPELDPQRLRLDHSRGVTPLFTNLPSGSQRLEHMAQQITRGAGSDFERAKLIVSYLGQWGEFDPRRPGDLTSSAPLDQFLFEGKAGSTLDFATATVMLARASGLPARLAVGLPARGSRLPLRGLPGAGERLPRLGRDLLR